MIFLLLRFSRSDALLRLFLCGLASVNAIWASHARWVVATNRNIFDFIRVIALIFFCRLNIHRILRITLLSLRRCAIFALPHAVDTDCSGRMVAKPSHVPRELLPHAARTGHAAPVAAPHAAQWLRLVHTERAFHRRRVCAARTLGCVVGWKFGKQHVPVSMREEVMESLDRF